MKAWLRRRLRRFLQIDRALHFDVNPSDRWIVSYPKSGNTWVRFLVGNLLQDEAVDFRSIGAVVPDAEATPSDTIAHRPGGRILKSHQSLQPAYGRVIYLVRDPRSVAVSYFHHCRKYGQIEEDLSLDSFVDRYVSGAVDKYGTWAEHVGGWIHGRRDRADFLWLRYEDLRCDPVNGLLRIAQHLGLEADAPALERAVERSNLSSMQQLERRDRQEVDSLRSGAPDQTFVRQGAVDEWRMALSLGARQCIESRWPTTMAELGYAVDQGGDATAGDIS